MTDDVEAVARAVIECGPYSTPNEVAQSTITTLLSLGYVKLAEGEVVVPRTRIEQLEHALNRAADVITTGRIVARQHGDSDWSSACERTEAEIRSALETKP